MNIDDPHRVSAIQRSGLLRHPQHDRLVHICYVASELLDCDAVQLNVVTASQHIFLAEWPRTLRQPLPAEQSGCREVVLSEEPVVVNDTRQDPLLCRMPWTAHFGGYLGVPVRHGSYVLGSLCALTLGPRVWTPANVLALESLAELACHSLD